MTTAIPRSLCFIALAKLDQPDSVVLDLTRSRVDSLTTARRLRSDAQATGILIIVTSGFLSDSAAAKGLAEGVNA